MSGEKRVKMDFFLLVRHCLRRLDGTQQVASVSGVLVDM